MPKDLPIVAVNAGGRLAALEARAASWDMASVPAATPRRPDVSRSFPRAARQTSQTLAVGKKKPTKNTFRVMNTQRTTAMHPALLAAHRSTCSGGRPARKLRRAACLSGSWA